MAEQNYCKSNTPQRLNIWQSFQTRHKYGQMLIIKLSIFNEMGNMYIETIACKHNICQIKFSLISQRNPNFVVKEHKRMSQEAATRSRSCIIWRLVLFTAVLSSMIDVATMTNLNALISIAAKGILRYGILSLLYFYTIVYYTSVFRYWKTYGIDIIMAH